MTPLQQRFVELDKKKAQYKEFLEQYNQTIKDLAREIGIGGHFQDYEGTVYQMAECEGTFVHFNKFEVKRTRREGERAGSLSLTKANELGYGVK